MPESIALNCDCMEYMRSLPDKVFDLAVVDPPYGGGKQESSKQTESGLHGGLGEYKGAIVGRFGGNFEKYYLGEADDRNGGAAVRHWDIAPPPEYFNELARVSKNQIIWGGNYFDLPPTRCFLIWRKLNIPLEGFSMAPVEYAWTSFNLNAAMCEFFSSGGSGRVERFHPTQKPVDLYTWIFKHYAKPGDRVLDTHLGSGSSRIAAYSLGFDFVGCEIDKTYFDLEEKRFETFTSQQSLFY